MRQIAEKQCLFCIWSDELRKTQEELGKKACEITPQEMANRFAERTETRWRSQFVMANEHFFAILSKEPKVPGHTLVISRGHFSGIADDSLLNEGTEFKEAFFDIMTNMAQKLTCLTEDKQFPKVYTMSMCEHWTKEDLDVAGKSYHTEHLHFHLLPRHKALRVSYPYFYPESVFVSPDRESPSQELEKTRDAILAEIYRSDLKVV